jgi:hypothetical protein
MTIRKIRSDWWILMVGFGHRRLVFFGATKKLVLGKWQSYLREQDLDKVRIREWDLSS